MECDVTRGSARGPIPRLRRTGDRMGSTLSGDRLWPAIAGPVRRPTSDVLRGRRSGPVGPGGGPVQRRVDGRPRGLDQLRLPDPGGRPEPGGNIPALAPVSVPGG